MFFQTDIIDFGHIIIGYNFNYVIQNTGLISDLHKKIDNIIIEIKMQ